MDEEKERKRDMNYRRAKLFYKKKTKIHISMIGGAFYNGAIDENPENDFFFIDDQKVGRQLVFFCELAKPIEEFKEEKDD